MKTKTIKKMPSKRLPPSATTRFNKKATTYLGYTTYFLSENMVVKLNGTVKVVRCKTANGIRLGIADLSEDDKTMVMDQERQLLMSFNEANGSSSATKFCSLFPSEIDMDETGSDMGFVNTSDNATTL